MCTHPNNVESLENGPPSTSSCEPSADLRIVSK